MNHTVDPRIINNITWSQKSCTDPYSLDWTNRYFAELTENERENMADETAQRAQAGPSVTSSIRLFKAAGVVQMDTEVWEILSRQ